MSDYFVSRSKLQGSIRLPPSKSQTLRALLFAALAEGTSTVHNYLDAPDTHAMVKACRALGATFEIFSDRMEVRGVAGRLVGADTVIDAGNSGIILRFLSALAALGQQPIVITGDHSIRSRRPMQPLLDALCQLGAKAVSTRGNGFAPLIIQGPWAGGTVKVNGSDSQPVSALLIAASFAPCPTTILVEEPGERPWVDLTLSWLDRLGLPFKRTGYERFELPGKACHKGFTYHVPGDFSSAAYPIVAALITDSEITVENLDMNDPQGDKKLIFTLQQMGADIDIEPTRLHVRKGGVLKGIEVDINDYVDAITILAVAGCFATGETRIRNAAVARQKECNRIGCVTSELKKMGASITEHADGLTVRQSSLTGSAVLSHADQRLALSLAVAGMAAEGVTHVHDVAWVAKTFPTFSQDMVRLGASIR